MAIVHDVERRQRAILAELVPAPDVPVDEAMRAWWRHISDPSLWPNERLFYELYGQAISGPAPHRGDARRDHRRLAGARRARSTWRYGLSREEALAHARLGIAVTRGLLLDLVATRDVEGVNAAMEAFIERLRHLAADAQPMSCVYATAHECRGAAAHHVRRLQRTRHRRRAGGDDRGRRLAQRLGGRPAGRPRGGARLLDAPVGVDRPPRRPRGDRPAGPSGRVAVEVRQVVRDLDGEVQAAGTVVHVYEMRSGLWPEWTSRKRAPSRGLRGACSARHARGRTRRRRSSGR